MLLPPAGRAEVDTVGILQRGRSRVHADEGAIKRAAIVLLLILSGCAIVSDHRTVAGCQVADGVTTYVALKKGAVELNTLFGSLSGSQILAIKLLMAWIVYKVLPEEPTDGDRFAMTIASGMGCVPALSNINVIRGMP